MKTTIDAAGRVVVPKALRQALGLQPGSAIEMRVSDGRIEMEPAPLEVRMEKRGGLVVAVPSAPVPSAGTAGGLRRADPAAPSLPAQTP